MHTEGSCGWPPCHCSTMPPTCPCPKRMAFRQAPGAPKRAEQVCADPGKDRQAAVCVGQEPTSHRSGRPATCTCAKKKCQRTKSLALLVHYTRARKKAPRGKVGPALAAVAARCGPPIPIPPFDSPIRQSTLDAAPASSFKRYETSAML